MQIQVDQATFNAATHTITADGPRSGDGDGGQIILLATSASLGSQSTALLSADAAPNGTGNAKNPDAIKFIVTSLAAPFPQITLGDTNGAFRLTARGGQNGGSGGGVHVDNGSGSIMIADPQQSSRAAINVSAPNGGNGQGGTIELGSSASPGVQFPTTHYPAQDFLVLNAAGHGSNGAGGTVTIDNNNAVTYGHNTTEDILNVNALIKVDPDPSITSTGTFGGRITINGINCRQYIGYSDYPKTWWDCINPDDPFSHPDEASVPIAANSIGPSATLKTQLASTLSPSNPTVQIYAMPEIKSFTSFFITTVADPIQLAGYTDLVVRASATFSVLELSGGGTESTSSFSGSPSIMAASIVHELGHQFDFIWGSGGNDYSASQSNWGQFIQPDMNLLNIDPSTQMPRPCNQVFAQSTCDANSDAANNQVIFDRLGGFSNKPFELFAEMFEHLQSQRTSVPPNPPLYFVNSDIESALNFMLNMRDQMNSLITNPPAAQQ